MSLWSYFLTNDGNEMCKWKHYFPAYEHHFARFVNRPIFVLEIGVNNGGSLQMWKQYFGPHAQIVGVDINPECAQLTEDQIEIRIGDQSDTDFLQGILDEFGTPDIVIDDGSHNMNHVRPTFQYLYPRTSPTGVYFVEDMHTAYWDDYDGGLGHPNSFIELAKSLIDELNAEWTRGAVTPTEFTKSTMSMHFYDSCVVFERGRVLPRTSPWTGKAPEKQRSWFGKSK